MYLNIIIEMNRVEWSSLGLSIIKGTKNANKI